MKKYKYIFIIALIIFIVPNIVMGQTTDQNQNTACNNKANGQDCSYKVQLSGRDPETADTPGKCDRRGDGRLYCNNTLTGWEDCFNRSQPNDACKNSSGQSGTCQRQGSGDNFTCDTTQPPTPPTATCGAQTCPSNQVCVNQGTPPVPTCTNNAATADGKCNGQTCLSNQVCVNQGTPPVPTCTASAATTPPTPTPTPGTTPSPQTITFNNPIKFDTIPKLIAGIINALLGILGAITVAVLVMSGFKYMTSSNPGEVGQALDGIKNAVIGLIIIMGAFLITQYVISALAV